MKAVDIASQVQSAKLIGAGNEKKALVVVNAKSVKDFRASIIANSDIRRTKRWDADRDIDNAVKNYVRWVANFHGKHIAGIEVVAATDKPDLVRTASGRFMKI